MDGYLAAMRKYATFSGRSRRGEYWVFHLVFVVLSIAASLLDLLIFQTGLDHQGPIGAVVLLAHLIPSFAVSVRRLHDIDRTGWWLLLEFTIIGALVLLIFAMQRGTAGFNRYGSDPLATPAAA
ncbi:DUF805 domain-containing protein [Azorhizobium doebereinerae]|uniref:DUF805 domain-containing protein n=1 Tax=Azorhizobium doebereinerae TaxID=281091 RepID=UPI00041A3D59|nr:DUF805 domain-containing protein [Azorhizobium doebereinerae]